MQEAPSSLPAAPLQAGRTAIGQAGQTGRPALGVQDHTGYPAPSANFQNSVSLFSNAFTSANPDDKINSQTRIYTVDRKASDTSSSVQPIDIAIDALRQEIEPGYTSNLSNSNTPIRFKEEKKVSRPTWRQSELDAAKDFPEYKAQKSFINRQEVPYGTRGSVRPDYYKSGHSIDIKNYNITNASGRRSLVRNIEKQYYYRIKNLPEGTKQSVIIDIRGQNVTDTDLSVLYNTIVKRTNKGIEIRFKID